MRAKRASKTDVQSLRLFYFHGVNNHSTSTAVVFQHTDTGRLCLTAIVAWTNCGTSTTPAPAPALEIGGRGSSVTRCPRRPPPFLMPLPHSAAGVGVYHHVHGRRKDPCYSARDEITAYARSLATIYFGICGSFSNLRCDLVGYAFRSKTAAAAAAAASRQHRCRAITSAAHNDSSADGRLQVDRVASWRKISRNDSAFESRRRRTHSKPHRHLSEVDRNSPLMGKDRLT